MNIDLTIKSKARHFAENYVFKFYTLKMKSTLRYAFIIH